MELDWGCCQSGWSAKASKLGSEPQEETIHETNDQGKGGMEAKGRALAKVLACWRNRKKAIMAGACKGEGGSGGT